MTYNGISYSKTDRVKREMSFGISKKRAWKMVKAYWKTFYGREPMKFC